MRWGRQAAGILPLACDTGRVLLALRSGEVMEPHTWGIPGGKLDGGELPGDAAIRELREELSYYGPMLLLPLLVYREPGFQYHNFIGLVSHEIDVELNWENDESGWFELDDLPEPLHFGVERMLETGGRERIRRALRDCGQISGS